jgi:predicted metal-dependent HD superfamily phosphohydrolase
VLSSSAEIALRAVTVAQAELKAHPDDANAELMREMALTMMAAATRLRFLTSMRTRESRGLFG